MNKHSHLRLVKEEPEEASTMRIANDPSMVQAELFPMAKPSLLIFADVSKMSGEFLLRLLNEARPTFVLDLRSTPRFDLERLNRRQVFEIFKQNRIHYIDVAGMAGIFSKWDTEQCRAILIGTINANLKHCGTSALEGPLLFLYDEQELLSYAMDAFPKYLVKSDHGDWNVYIAK